MPSAQLAGVMPCAADRGGDASQESSPTKLLPPTTPGPSLLDAAAAQGEQSPPSALTQALQQSTSVPPLAGIAPAAAAAAPRPWASLAAQRQQQQAAAAGGLQDEEGDALVHDGVLVFTAPAAALDPQLLVHSPESSLEDGCLLAVDTTAAAAAAAAAAGGDGECTPRLSAVLRQGGEDLLSPTADGISLADLLQGPAPPRVPDMAHSPSSRPGPFLHGLPHLDEGHASLSASPRRSSLHLPGCSPLPPALSGLREPMHLPGMQLPPVPRPPMLAAAPLPYRPAPSLLRTPGPGALPPPGRRPAALPHQRPLPGMPPPPVLAHAPQGRPLMRPPPMGLRPPLPLPGGPQRPTGGQLVMPHGMLLPMSLHAYGGRGREDTADWPPAEDVVMTAEGVRRVAAVRATLLPQQAEPTGSGNGSGTSPAAGAAEKQQQQQQQAANGQGAGVAVAVQPVAAVPAPAGPAVFASIQAEAAAGAAAAAAAILSAPTAAAASPAAAAAAAAPAAAPDTAAFNPAQQSASFRRFLAMIRGDSHEFEAQGRVLRLRQYLRPDVGPRVLEAVFEALESNTRVEALYCQNFEQGLLDAQLEALTRLLRRGRIWAVNAGENFGTSQEAWRRFCDALPATAVGYLFVSEPNLAGTDLKARMRDAIRANRKGAPPRDPEVIVHVGNMWWNPRLPGYAPSAAATAAAVAAGAAAVVTVPAPASAGWEKEKEREREASASREGREPSGLSAGGSAGGPAEGGSAGGGSAAAPSSAAGSGNVPAVEETAAAVDVAAAAGDAAAAVAAVVAAAAAGISQEVQLPGPYPLLASPKRRYESAAEEANGADSPLAKRGPGASSFAAEAANAAAAAAAAEAALVGGRRRPSRASAARLLLRQHSDLSSDEEKDEAEMEGDDEEDAIYLPFKSGLLVSQDPHAAPTRASQRIQRRQVHAYQGHLPMDNQFVTFDGAEEGGSPPRSGAAARRARAAAAAAAAAPPPGGSNSGALPPPPAGAPKRAPLQPAPMPALAAAPRAAAPPKRSHSGGGRARATLTRPPSGELKGKPSFAELVESGFMRAGEYRFTVGMQDIHAALEPDGLLCKKDKWRTGIAPRRLAQLDLAGMHQPVGLVLGSAWLLATSVQLASATALTPLWAPALAGAALGGVYSAMFSQLARSCWCAPPAPLRVLVTGGSQGIGKALAREFLRCGDRVLVTSRSEAGAEAAVANLKEEVGSDVDVVGLMCDVSNAASVDALLGQALEQLGGLPDVILNNAGYSGSYKSLSEMSAEQVEQVVRTNLLGSLLITRASMRAAAAAADDAAAAAGGSPAQQRGGRAGDEHGSSPVPHVHVFNMEGAGSDGSATPQYAAYGATKAALAQLLRSLQAEAKALPAPVSVHNLSPGMVLTPLLLEGATPQAKQAFNILCEHPETVAAFLVPRVRSVVARGQSGAAIRFLTPARAVGKLLAAPLHMGRYFDSDGEPVFLPERERILGQRAKRTERLQRRAARRSGPLQFGYALSMALSFWLFASDAIAHMQLPGQ
ncbi:chlorophyll b reductase [Micractinium conductrix]|uniref:Chlorophyll b reductase n=1 Tax=Micractinium conductrix TaxID=554055 RepID=A0A2P6V9N6_9CHLO|nr:chlorophyll b reductase [Micractinium conductrix]|eukprot:PSC70796.1 chlorophyll b reductase [Micractinium conductrix]